MAFDSANGVIYIGGGICCYSGGFAKYTVSNNSVTYLSYKISGFWNRHYVFSIAFYPANGGVVYLGGHGGLGDFARYNTATYTGGGTYPDVDTAYSLSSKITGLNFSCCSYIYETPVQ